MITPGYKVIGIDLFQTLVDVNARLDVIWQRILDGDHSDDLQQMYESLASERIFDAFHLDFSQSSDFRSLKEIYLGCFEEIFAATGANYSPVTATAIYMDEHDKAQIYADSLPFLERAREKYRVCLVSDADEEMVESHMARMPFDDVFISERLKAYKGNPDGMMFRSVLEQCGVEPSEMLHIGDSSSDIAGAHRARIDSCWINRHGYDRQFDVTPTYEVESLAALYQVLDI